MSQILPNTDGGLLTAENCALVFIDHQPQMAFGVGNNIDRQQLVNNVLMLAKGAKEFGVPTILTTVATGMRRPLMQGTPPIRLGFIVMRSKAIPHLSEQT